MITCCSQSCLFVYTHGYLCDKIKAFPRTCVYVRRDDIWRNVAANPPFRGYMYACVLFVIWGKIVSIDMVFCAQYLHFECMCKYMYTCVYVSVYIHAYIQNTNHIHAYVRACAYCFPRKFPSHVLEYKCTTHTYVM